ncbi:MAG: hypothetical protein ACI841_004641 [Planctomycetota bacterium]
MLELDGIPARVTSIISRAARSEGLLAIAARLRELPDEDQKLVLYRGIAESRS